MELDSKEVCITDGRIKSNIDIAYVLKALYTWCKRKIAKPKSPDGAPRKNIKPRKIKNEIRRICTRYIPTGKPTGEKIKQNLARVSSPKRSGVVDRSGSSPDTAAWPKARQFIVAQSVHVGQSSRLPAPKNWT